ncbi:hypothetical protein [Candidatus Ponderosibacter sp. Uisw_141_02]
MIFEVMIFGVVVRHNSTPNPAASHHRTSPRINLPLGIAPAYDDAPTNP